MEETNFESVPFLNIDSEVFVGYWDSKAYTIKPGETKFYPEFLANHLAKHLSDKLMQEKGISLNDHSKRAEIVAEILNYSHPKADVKPLTKKSASVKKKIEKISKEKPFADLKN